MSVVVTGSPLGPFADAVLQRLLDTPAVTALVGTRIKAATKEGTRTPAPYITAERRNLNPGSVAMGCDGGEGEVWLDIWSEKNGTHEVHQVLSAIRAALPRDLVLEMPGYRMFGGSLHLDEESVFADFDKDMPQRSLMHGQVAVIADLEAV